MNSKETVHYFNNPNCWINFFLEHNKLQDRKNIIKYVIISFMDNVCEQRYGQKNAFFPVTYAKILKLQPQPLASATLHQNNQMINKKKKINNNGMQIFLSVTFGLTNNKYQLPSDSELFRAPTFPSLPQWWTEWCHRSGKSDKTFSWLQCLRGEEAKCDFLSLNFCFGAINCGELIQSLNKELCQFRTTSGIWFMFVCAVCVNNRKALILKPKKKKIHAFNYSFHPHFSEINGKIGQKTKKQISAG